MPPTPVPWCRLVNDFVSQPEIAQKSIKNPYFGVQGHPRSLNGLRPKHFKMGASIITRPLTILFTKSIETGVLPSDWKMAVISPIHKKGNKLEVGNYRDISLTPIPCKIFESIVRDQMLSHLESHNILTTNQHGFVKKRSCLTNLLETLGSWTKTLDGRKGLDVLYLDYQKAFDMHGSYRFSVAKFPDFSSHGMTISLTLLKQ